MKKLLNVIKKIICVFGGIILILVIQASISSILRLINPTEEDPEEKKELEVEAVYTGGGTFSLNTEEERLKGKKFYPTIQEAVAGSAVVPDCNSFCVPRVQASCLATCSVNAGVDSRGRE